MSYKKLDIKDFVDKWDVSKVRHLEDAIIENEKAINNISLTPGPQGEQGPRGEQGIQGEQGLQGEQGVPGKSAYEYAKEAGYSGSEEEFSQKLNQENLSLDNTLSVEGAAADAKAVGEAIANINTSEKVQADWDQSDETAPDFVKNRPCYKFLSSSEEILFQASLNFSVMIESYEENGQTKYRWNANSYIIEPEQDLLKRVNYSQAWIRTRPWGCNKITDITSEVAESGNGSNQYDYEIKTEYFIISSIWSRTGEDTYECNTHFTPLTDPVQSEFGEISIFGVQDKYYPLDIQYIPYSDRIFTLDDDNGYFPELPTKKSIIKSIKNKLVDYDNLRNRPFYYEPISYTDYFYPNKDAVDYAGHIQGTSPIILQNWIRKINEGDTYIVHFDSKDYNCTAYTIDQDESWYYFLGNAYLYNQSAEDTGEPFCVRFDADLENGLGELYYTGELEYSTREGGARFTIHQENSEKLVPLDAKFLPEIPEEKIPDTIARTADVPSVDATFSQSGAAADALVTGNNIKNIGKTVSSLERVSRYLTGSDWYLKIDTINNTVTIPAGLLMSGTWGLPITEQTIDISQEYDTTLVVYDSSTSAIRNISCTEFVAKSMYIIATITRDFYDKPNYNQIQGPYMVDGVMINSMAHTTTTVIDDIITAPTAEQFNALLQVLRDAGILATD